MKRPSKLAVKEYLVASRHVDDVRFARNGAVYLLGIVPDLLGQFSSRPHRDWYLAGSIEDFREELAQYLLLMREQAIARQRR